MYVSIQIELYLQKFKPLNRVQSLQYVVYLPSSFTFSGRGLSIDGCCHAELFGRAETSAVEEYWQVDDVLHVVMSVDVRVSQHTVEVLVDGFDDNMGVTGKHRDKRAFGEEYPHLE